MVLKYRRLVTRSLGRKKVRTALTLGSFAVALFLFGLLSAIHTALVGGLEATSASRLSVINRVSLIQPLPVSYGRRGSL